MKRYIFRNKFTFSLVLLGKITLAAMNVGIAFLLQIIVNTALGGDLTKFVQAVIFSMAYGITFFVTETVYRICVEKYIQNSMSKMREDAMTGLFKKSVGEFSKQDTGKYLSDLTNNIKLIEDNYIIKIFNTMNQFFYFVISAAVIITINWAVALSLIGISTLLLVTSALFGKPISVRQGKYSSRLDSFTMKLKELFSGYSVLKGFNGKDRALAEFGENNHQLNTTKKDFVVMQGIAENSAGFLSFMLQIGSLALAGYFVLIGDMDAGTMIAIIQLANGILSPILNTANNVTAINGSKEIVKNMLSLIGTPCHDGSLSAGFLQEISVNNLCYRYDNQEQDALSNFSYRFEKNKKYLILGKSGSGKSTLVKILAGIYRDYKGEIKLDGQELREISPQSYNEISAYAGQDAYLFKRTVRDNIDFLKTGDDINLSFAVEKAALPSFVERQPQGLDTVIDEEVNQVSGGEKARISLARALFKRCDLLYTDEVISALDTKTAFEAEENLLHLSGTQINITHKTNKTLLPLYDSILIFDKGELVFSGSYEQMLSDGKGSKFAETFIK